MGGPTVWGSWLMVFEGSAVISPLNNMHGATVTNQVYDAATDATTATLVVPEDPASCNCIMVAFFNASTRGGGPGIKSLKILQPGYSLAQADDFSQPFLDLMGRADVLRFMQMTHTIGNLIENWADRPTPTLFSYATQGLPWEDVFRLANTLMVDPWINVPAHASDDYVLQLAKLAKATLAPSLHVYLEFSNEVWNWGGSRERPFP